MNFAAALYFHCENTIDPCQKRCWSFLQMLEVWIRKLAKEEFFLFFTHSFDNESLILTEKEEAP